MNRRIFWAVSLTLLAIAVFAPLMASAQSKSFPMRENNEGQVRASVTPQNLSKTADAWRFEVRFNTHVTPITQDMLAVASLLSVTARVLAKSRRPGKAIRRAAIIAGACWCSSR
jgi:hypothetical protein